MTHSARTLVMAVNSILILLSTTARAGNGRINGWVRASGSGLPLQASVRVLGTGIGATTDSAGRFVLMNVPPGSHTVRATSVGWAPMTYGGVVLHQDQILILTFALTPEEIVLTEMVVESTRPAIDPSKTSGGTRFESDDFTALPVHTPGQVLRLSAASFGESVRGGRANQTATIIDGIDVSDRLDPWYGDLAFKASGSPISTAGSYAIQTTDQRSSGSALLEPPLMSIEQGELFAGTWGPEYGGVSGAFSYTLREGRGRWSGSAYARISQLGGLDHLGPDVYNDQAVYEAERAKRAASSQSVLQWESTLFSWSPGTYSYGDDPELEGGFGIGGPLGDDAGLYMTMEYLDTHGRLPGFHFRQFDGTLKLSASPWNSTRLSVTGLLEDRGRLFGWKNRPYLDTYRYFLEGVPATDGVAAVGGVKFTHTLTPTSFYEVQANVNYRNSRTGYCDDNNDGQISLGEDGDFLTWEDTAQVNRYQATRSLAAQRDKFFAVTGVSIVPAAGTPSFVVAGPPILYKDISSAAYSIQLLFSSAAGPHHTLTAGLRGTLYELSVLTREGGAGAPAVRSCLVQDWSRWPREVNAYVQDRMEYAGLFINAGLRVDIYDTRSSDYLNWYRPYQLGVGADGAPMYVQVRGPEVPPRAYFSPRLGVSHPVSDVLAVHFSVSIAHQPLPYSLLYSGYRTFGQLGPLVRISQEPQRSTSYEFGVQWSPVDDLAVNIDAYQKDYVNYFGHEWGAVTAVQADLGGVSTPVNVVTSHGSVLCRGMEISLHMRRAQPSSSLGISGRASYSYSYAVGGMESNRSRRIYSVEAGDSARYGGTLPFEDTERWEKTFIHIPAGAFSTLRGYDRQHRFTCSGVFFLPAGFTVSMTGRFASGFYYPLPTTVPYVTGWGEGPWNKQIDIRLEKGFALGGSARFSIYADLVNAFNWSNVVALVGDPTMAGNATMAWINNQDPTGGPLVNRPVTSGDGTLIYGPPREVYFGARFDF